MGSGTTDAEVYKVGIYGWRKRCLYLLIVILAVVIVLNFALTVWMMHTMKLHLNGMGSLSHNEDIGVSMDDVAEFDRPIYVDKLSPKKKFSGPLDITSDNSVLFQANKESKLSSAKLPFILMESDSFHVSANKFQILDKRERSLFETRDGKVHVTPNNLQVLGIDGAVFNGALATSRIQTSNKQNLRLSVPTRTLECYAAQNASFNTSKIRMKAYESISIKSLKNKFRMKAKEVFLRDTREHMMPKLNSTDQQFQVCMCRNGRLYSAARGSKECRARRHDCRQ